MIGEQEFLDLVTETRLDCVGNGEFLYETDQSSQRKCEPLLVTCKARLKQSIRYFRAGPICPLNVAKRSWRIDCNRAHLSFGGAVGAVGGSDVGSVKEKLRGVFCMWLEECCWRGSVVSESSAAT